MALERQVNGERVPILLLDTGSQRVEVHLEDHYYRGLIKELQAREGASSYNSYGGSKQLTLRIYHLPHPPVTVEYKGRTRNCYKGNAYTMAILEPDILLNITDLNQAQYCSRQYLLNRMIPSAPSAATIRGNLVHHCFKELLKEHDQGKLHTIDVGGEIEGKPASARQAAETPLEVMQRHLEQALQLNSIEMALTGVSLQAMREDVAPHLDSLARWYESERNTLWDMPGVYAIEQASDGDEHGKQSEQSEQTSGNQVRAETFLLAPEIGLRGRLDLFWQQSGRQRLLELKTGGASGELPKTSHRWQVNGYHALLAVRRDSRMKKALATLLYSGTPGKAQAIGIPATIRDLQRVNETRNTLILNRITSIPSAPPGASRCSKCAMLEQCQTISSLLQWQPPAVNVQGAPPHDDVLTPSEEEPTHSEQSEEAHKDGGWHNDAIPALAVARVMQDNKQEQEFFAKYYRLLQIEGRAGEQQQALLWVTPVEERIERGTAIRGLKLQGRPSMENDGWNLVFRCNNTSELREGDEILLSNGNPVTGEVVSGTIIAISTEHLTIWVRELIAHPDLIDRYDNELVHVRTLQNLLRWHYAPPHRRDLVAGRIRPRFRGETVSWRSDFNREQNLAVERALQMQDYLLIHGPPGTGKTSVIAEIVKRLSAQGQRIMLAAFTNQAVDNMLKRLDKEGFHDYLRLGHERSVDQAVKPHLLKELIATSITRATIQHEPGQAETPPAYADIVYDLLQHTPVVASTTATWSSDKYTPQTPGQGTAAESTGFAFDVAIIDEAGQLTIPAILGVLRFARRFILVGDEKQLPPLVLSKEAAIEGLADSLFSFLKGLDDDYMTHHPLAVSACVPLRIQYRMNKWISHFSSTVFYEQRLVAHDSVANRRLVYTGAGTGQLAREDERTLVLKAIDPRYPLVFLDVRDGEARPEAKTSDAEARVLREIVMALLSRGIMQKDIGIIAPYRAQVANIRRHLFSNDPESQWRALPFDTPLSVDTVDRFQGGERMILLMSFATAHEPALQSQRRDFLSNPQRLNVALTRAQRKLILVGNVPALEHLPTFNRLITYCRSMQTLIAATEHAVL
ncbi:MAG: DEAD/DEAH box helicase [Ktedonobacteraceae bacterium]